MSNKQDNGNSAAMRAALRTCLDFIMRLDRAFNPFMQNLLENAIAKAESALAAPPRNFDRFASAEEAWDAYDEWVESYRSKGQVEPFNEFGWLFAPEIDRKGEGDGR